MKRSRFSTEQIVAILAQTADGSGVAEVCRRHGIGPATFYAWRRKFGAESSGAIARIRELEALNAALRRNLSRREEDAAALSEVLQGLLQTTGERRAAVRWLVESRAYSERRACALAACERSTFRYATTPPDRFEPTR